MMDCSLGLRGLGAACRGLGEADPLSGDWVVCKSLAGADGETTGANCRAVDRPLGASAKLWWRGLVRGVHTATVPMLGCRGGKSKLETSGPRTWA